MSVYLCPQMCCLAVDLHNLLGLVLWHSVKGYCKFAMKIYQLGHFYAENKLPHASGITFFRSAFVGLITKKDYGVLILNSLFWFFFTGDVCNYECPLPSPDKTLYSCTPTVLKSL